MGPSGDEYSAPADRLSAAAREAIDRHARENAEEEARIRARDAGEDARRRQSRNRAEDVADAAERQASTPDPDQPQPDVLESLRQLGEAGRSSLGAAGDAARALRTLVSADFSLARSAMGRTLAFTGMAIAFGATAWLLLMAALIVFLSREAGLPWSVSMLLTSALSIAITWFAAWQAMRYFDHTRMQATRRQLARLGIGELADFSPRAGDARSAKDVAEESQEENGDRPLKDDKLGVDVTPP